MIRRSSGGTAFHRRPQARGKPILLQSEQAAVPLAVCAAGNFPSRGTSCRTAPGPIEEKGPHGRGAQQIRPASGRDPLTASAGGGTAETGPYLRHSGSAGRGSASAIQHNRPNCTALRRRARPAIAACPRAAAGRHGFPPPKSKQPPVRFRRRRLTARFAVPSRSRLAAVRRQTGLPPAGRRCLSLQSRRIAKNSRSAGGLPVMASTLTYLSCRPHIGAGLGFSQDNAPDIVERNITLHKSHYNSVPASAAFFISRETGAFFSP